MSATYLVSVGVRAADARPPTDSSSSSRAGGASSSSPLPSHALPLFNESAADAAARGMREAATFSYRGVEINYRELPDAASNLLFDNVCWPAAETLARLLVDQAKGGAKIWTPAACMQLGLPLEMLLSRRFGMPVLPPPSPCALTRLGLDTLLPNVSRAGTRVLEVGAGVGISGLACHVLGADVLLTDGESRLVEHCRACHHAAAASGRLQFAMLDWHADDLGTDVAPFDVILGVEVLNPACAGELHVPRLVARRLARRAGARCLLLSDVRRVETCATAVRELTAVGLRVAAFRVCNGREAVEVALDTLVEVGATLLLVATWPPPGAPSS